MSKRVFSKNVLAGVLLLILLISPTIAVGKDNPLGKWWHNPRVSEQLNLSEEEKSKLDEIFVESRRKLIDLKSSVEREQFELRTSLKARCWMRLPLWNSSKGWRKQGATSAPSILTLYLG